MSDADILMDTDSTEMKNGDVSVAQKFTVSGDSRLKGRLTVHQQTELLDSLVISQSAGNPVVTIDATGSLQITFPNSSRKISIGANGIQLRDSHGN